MLSMHDFPQSSPTQTAKTHGIAHVSRKHCHIYAMHTAVHWKKLQNSEFRILIQ